MKKVKAGLEEIRRHLRKHVEGAGLTQEKLAVRLKVSRATVSNVLRPEGQSFTVETLLKILGAIGVPPREFFAALYGLSGPDMETRFSSLLDVLSRRGVIGRDHLQKLMRSEDD